MLRNGPVPLPPGTEINPRAPGALTENPVEYTLFVYDKESVFGNLIQEQAREIGRANIIAKLLAAEHHVPEAYFEHPPEQLIPLEKMMCGEVELDTGVEELTRRFVSAHDGLGYIMGSMKLHGVGFFNRKSINRVYHLVQLLGGME
jgi:hypothetical protein